MNIQVKATEQYFSVVLFIILYKVVLTFESVDEILSVTIQTKATEQYFPDALRPNFGTFKKKESKCSQIFFSHSIGV